MDIYPESALSIPPRMLSSVDFPEPEDPKSTQNSPFATEKFMPRSTSCRVSPLPNPFLIYNLQKLSFFFIHMIFLPNLNEYSDCLLILFKLISFLF